MSSSIPLEDLARQEEGCLEIRAQKDGSKRAATVSVRRQGALTAEVSAVRANRCASSHGCWWSAGTKGVVVRQPRMLPLYVRDLYASRSATRQRTSPDVG